jgi:hypothetical protein
MPLGEESSREVAPLRDCGLLVLVVAVFTARPDRLHQNAVADQDERLREADR